MHDLHIWTVTSGFGALAAHVVVSTDCDRDAVLLKVEAIGPGVCHEGYESCFFRQLDGGEWKITEARAYDPGAVYGN